MKKKFSTVLIILISISIFSEENILKFKPIETIKVIKINNNSKGINTTIWDYCYFIIGYTLNDEKIAICIRTYSSSFENYYNADSIIINNESYNKKLKIINFENKVKFSLFSTWYYISLINDKITKEDYYDISLSNDIINKLLFEKYQIKTVIDYYKKSKILFKEIKPMEYTKLPYSEIKVE